MCQCTAPTAAASPQEPAKPKQSFDPMERDQEDAYRPRPRGAQLRRFENEQMGDRAHAEVVRLLQAEQQRVASNTT